MRIGTGIALALAAAAGCAAPAAAAGMARFAIGGVEVLLPVPDGYCYPAESEVEWARLLAAIDDSNVTHLTLVDCANPTGDDYILFKTPNGALDMPVERQQLLDEVAATLESPEMKELLESGALSEETEEAGRRVAGLDLDLSGTVKVLGRDDTCVYIGGLLGVSTGTVSRLKAVASCMTAVAGRVVSINWYGPAAGNESVFALLRKARRLADRMTGATGK